MSNLIKYPIFMGSKERKRQLDLLLNHLNKRNFRCPICKFRYKKDDEGKCYCIEKKENPKFYPQDYIEGVCPICKLLNEKDESFCLDIYKEDLDLIKRIILFQLKQSLKGEEKQNENS